MFQRKVVEKIKTHILCSTFFDKCAVYEIMWKNPEQPDRPQTYGGASALHAGYFGLQAHTQNSQQLWFFHCNNASTSMPQC